MKTAKKILAVMFALVLLTAACLMPAMAAVGTGASDPVITIDTTEAGHTYTAYQVFTGDLSGTAGSYVLSNIVWGDGVSGSALLSAIQADSTFEVSGTNLFASATTAAQVADAMTGSDFTPAMGKKFAKLAYANKSATDSGSDDDSTTIGDLTTDYNLKVNKTGYYLVVDELPNGTEAEAESAFILCVVGDTTVTPKSNSTPTLDKTSGTAHYVSDKVPGDTISYTLKATLPGSGTLAEYTTYKLVFTDKLSTNLTLDSSSIVVKVDGGTAISSTAYSASIDTDNTLTVTIDDVKASPFSCIGGEDITVDYNAELKDTHDSDTSTDNTATLTYSHDPNNSAEYGTTPSAKVRVWTFDFTLTKQFSDGENHTAKFKLYKGNDPADKTSANLIESEKTISANGGTATWSKLPDGAYILEESEWPTGFNKADDLYFTITTTDDGLSRTITPTGGVSANSGTGAVTYTLMNQTGATLPETGGIGTTIFVTVGAVGVLSAGIFLLTNKRVRKEDI